MTTSESRHLDLDYYSKYKKAHKEHYAEVNHTHYINNRESYLERAKDWVAANPIKVKKSSLKYRRSKKGIDSHLNGTFRRKYGISLEQYSTMLDLQNNKCAICNHEETARRKGIVRRLSIDHCHTTKRVRKLLCGKCNTMIGHANDSIERLEQAIRYLRES